MTERLRFDAHLEKTNIPETIEGLLATGTELLHDSTAQASPYRENDEKSFDDGIWKRSDETQPQHYIHLGVHALRQGGMTIGFDSHRPLDHRFPEPPVDMNEIVQRRPYEEMSLSVFPLDGRFLPVLYPAQLGRPSKAIYPSSLDAKENDVAAERFAIALDQFQESLFLNLSILGLVHEAQEKRMRSAIAANAS